MQLLRLRLELVVLPHNIQLQDILMDISCMTRLCYPCFQHIYCVPTLPDEMCYACCNFKDDRLNQWQVNATRNGRFAERYQAMNTTLSNQIIIEQDKYFMIITRMQKPLERIIKVIITSHDCDNCRLSWFMNFLHLFCCKVAFAVISFGDDTHSPRCLPKMISSLHN